MLSCPGAPSQLRRSAVGTDAEKVGETKMTDNLSTILILAVVGAVTLVTLQIYFRHWKRKKRFEELHARFGPEAAEYIYDEKLFLGMTKEMLLEAWGEPADIVEENVRSKIKQTWKYNQVGVNRYEDRVSLEDDVVVGWKSRRMDPDRKINKGTEGGNRSFLTEQLKRAGQRAVRGYIGGLR